MNTDRTVATRYYLIRVARVARFAAIVLIFLMFPVPTSWAGPGADESPTPEMPGRGISGWFIDPPTNIPPMGKEDKFTADGVPRFETYAMSGMHWAAYDLGTGPDVARAPDAVIGTMVGNWIFDSVKFGVGITAAVTNAAYDPSYLGVFDDLIRRTVNVLRTSIFGPWIGVTLAMIGVMLLWRSRKAQMNAAVKTTAWAILVIVAVSVVFSYPVKAASSADGVVGEVLGSVHDGISGDTSTDPSAAAAQNLYYALLWRQWLVGNFGSADSVAAKKFGADLFDAQSLTWSEAAVLDKELEQRATNCQNITGYDPQCFSKPKIITDKEEAWKDIANDIQSFDPDGYEYLTGKQSANRVWAAMIAFLAALCVLPLLFMSAILIIASYLIVRLAVMMFPAIAVVGVIDAMSGLVKGVLNVVGAAIINCLVFGIGAAINMLGVTVLLSPQANIPTWLGILLSGLLALVMWFALKPARRLTSMMSPNRNVMADTAGSIRSAGNSVTGIAKTAAGVAIGTKIADDDEDDKAERGESFTAPAPVPTTAPTVAPAAAPAPVAEPAPAGPAPEVEGVPAPSAIPAVPVPIPVGVGAAVPPAVEADTVTDTPTLNSATPVPGSEVDVPDYSPTEHAEPLYVPGSGDRPETVDALPDMVEPETDDDGSDVYVIYQGRGEAE